MASLFLILCTVFSIAVALLNRQPAAETDWSELGQFGDYIGGFWGTILAALSVALLAATWLYSKNNDYRNSIVTLLSELLTTHDNISARYPNSVNTALRELSAVYKITQNVVPSYRRWTVDDRIDIAYTIVFYGLSSHVDGLDKKYGRIYLKRVRDETHALRRRAVRFAKLFNGHQASLSHMMRNLFAAYTLIDSSKLSSAEKLLLGKVVRSKLSNYDQGLLAANVISHLGRAWEIDGLIDKYKPISNIPRRFFGHDDRINLKDRFPNIKFEWETAESFLVK